MSVRLGARDDLGFVLAGGDGEGWIGIHDGFFFFLAGCLHDDLVEKVVGLQKFLFWLFGNDRLGILVADCFRDEGDVELGFDFLDSETVGFLDCGLDFGEFLDVCEENFLGTDKKESWLGGLTEIFSFALHNEYKMTKIPLREFRFLRNKFLRQRKIYPLLLR